MRAIRAVVCALTLLLVLTIASASDDYSVDPSRTRVASQHARTSPYDAGRNQRQAEDDLSSLLAIAHHQRANGNHEAASNIYDEIVERANTTSPCIEMWAAYQHGDLLMKHFSPAIETQYGIDRGNLAKEKAISRFKMALSTSERCPSESGGSIFGPAEQLHAFNSIGLMLIDLYRFDEAIESLRAASNVNTTAPEPIGNLVLAYAKAGKLSEAQRWNHRVLDILPNDPRVLHNSGAIALEMEDKAQAAQYWERALQMQPDAVQTLTSLASLYGSQGDFEKARNYLERAALVTATGPILSSIRLQQALSHLKMIYNSTADLASSRRNFEAALRELLTEQILLPDPMTTTGSGSMGYYAVYHGFNDRTVRQQLAQIYRQGAAHELTYTAPHVAEGRFQKHVFQAQASPSKPVSDGITVHSHRIRVGFHSAFLRHHSAGLLLSGVIRHLNRDQFHVVVIIYDTSPSDYLTKQVLDTADQVLVIPERQLRQAQHLVASLELDVQVYSEIGMHAATYFLAFAELALRTAAFWGHAVTNGIDTVDYFVSSRLFNRDLVQPDDQDRYTECLYDMQGLSTMFPRPPAPHHGLARASFQLPQESVMPHLVLVPQTLYKLHPEFDAVIQGILSAVSTSILVLPVGDTPLLVEQLTQRWRNGGIISDDVYRRVFFVRRMNQTEFLALCEMADVVIDPFPLGGGRSSLEIFSVGTPILGITTRTTVLQLTLGFYRRMGIDASCCMVESVEQLVATAIEVLRDDTARQELRQQIQRNRHKLYEASNALVVREWEAFFRSILASPPPTTSLLPQPALVVPKPLYELHVSNVVPVGGGSDAAVRVIRLFEGDDPFDLATAFTGDILKAAFLAKLLWNYQQRFRLPVVDRFSIQVANVPAPITIEIREGNDLYQIIRWQMEQQTEREDESVNDDELVASVVRMASERSPQYTSQAWRAARSVAPLRPFDSTDGAYRDCIALVMTTCKRLQLFVRTVASLQKALGITHDSQWLERFCAVVVVDDNSSPEDRQWMQRLYPRFTFYDKSPQEKGHARSLNIALQLVKDVRFVFYLEDDWEFRATQGSSFLDDAVKVLKATSLVQLLLNDQRGGWPAQLSSQRIIEYAVHEFAIMDPAHTFSYWPGFSLNPGVWDMGKLGPVFRRRKPWFGEDSDIFEREFSLDVWREGMEIGYLRQGEVCKHIGAAPGSNASAYVLNGLPRRFD